MHNQQDLYQCVFSVEYGNDLSKSESIRRQCDVIGCKCAHGYQTTGNKQHGDDKVLLIECSTKDVAVITDMLVLLDVRFLMAPLQRPLRDDGGLCTPCEQALYTHFSRRKNPRWWASVDWFDAHRHEFKAGDYVVIRDAVVLHRCRNKQEHLEWLVRNGDGNTLAHHSVHDGVEMKYFI